MTAPALNSASMTPPGPRAPNAATATPGRAVTGFDALMAALFPQPGAGEGQVVAAGNAAAPLSPAPDALSSTDAEPKTAGDETPLIDSEAQATSVATSDTLFVPVAPAPIPASAPDTASVETGANRRPAIDAAAMASGPSTDWAMAETSQAADTSATLATTGPTPTSPGPVAAPAAPAQAPTAAGSGQPAAPAQPQSQTFAADAPVDDTVIPPPPQPAPETPAVTASAASTAASILARPEPAPAPPPRASRADRSASVDAAPASPAKGAPTAAAVSASAVNATANNAAAGNDSPDAAEAAALDAGPAVETNDSTPAVEARAASHTEASSATPSTTAPVRGSPETVAALAAQIIKKLEGRSTRFDVELNPDGLGKVDVRIEFGAQGRMTASLTFDNAQAAQDLKARANDLQRAMEQAGFDMSGGFSFDLAQDHGRQHQGWQDARPEMSDSFRGKAFRAALETAGDAADAAAQGALQLRRGVNAGLDLRI